MKPLRRRRRNAVFRREREKAGAPLIWAEYSFFILIMTCQSNLEGRRKATVAPFFCTLRQVDREGYSSPRDSESS